MFAEKIAYTNLLVFLPLVNRVPDVYSFAVEGK
jgi:hypothetical protein